MASAKKRTPSARKYTAFYTDENGVTRARIGFSDKGETLRLAQRLQDEARKRRLGLADDAAEKMARHARADIGEHVEAHLTHLESKGTGAQRRGRVRGAVSDAIDAAGWGCVADITPESMGEHVKALTAGGMSAAAVNARIGAVKGFTRWIWTTNRCQRDPLASIRPLRTSDDRRLQRRALSPEEMDALLAHVASAGELVTIPKRYSYKGEIRTGKRNILIPNRAMLYRLMLGTGFRVAEAASLRGGDFELSSEPPVVRVRAGYTKNRKPVAQPIRRDLAEALRPLIAQTGRQALVWPKVPGNMAPAVMADMNAARAAWVEAGGDPESDFLQAVDSEGRRVDAHAFRHTFCSTLARSNAPVRVVQELARHSDPRLTMSTYSHVRLADSAQALNALPKTGPASERATPAQHFTGT